jgi:hypothetical protein
VEAPLAGLSRKSRGPGPKSVSVTDPLGPIRMSAQLELLLSSLSTNQLLWSMVETSL